MTPDPFSCLFLPLRLLQHLKRFGLAAFLIGAFEHMKARIKICVEFD